MPSSRRLRISQEADDDITGIVQYTTETWGERQADIYAAKLQDVFADLVRFPGIGRKRDEIAPGMRSYVAEQHIILYQAEDDAVVIVRVLHARQDIAEAFRS